jgi:hypothetical protein
MADLLPEQAATHTSDLSRFLHNVTRCPVTFGRVTATPIILIFSAKRTRFTSPSAVSVPHVHTLPATVFRNEYRICLPLDLVSHTYTSLSGVQSPPLSNVMQTFHQLSHTRPQTAVAMLT